LKIVVDCGGTKGDWRYIRQDGSALQIQSKGFNPVLHSMWDLEQIIKSDLPAQEEDVSAVYYYGAGVHGDTIRHSMASTLRKLLKADHVEVNTDLIAACRATCQDEEGIVAILGTGSASCYYDGKGILDKVPSLGYIAGDEGAGSCLGKRILQAYFYREMPEHIQSKFEENYTLTREEILENIYKRPGANSYLASFANFALTQKNESYIENIIREEFDRFVRRHLLKYNNAKKTTCHFVGSIAWFLQDQLKDSLDQAGLTIGSVIRKPIDDLVAYHTR
jgi:glucosamine kinase